MASIAAKAERLGLAVMAIEDAMINLAAARAIDAPPLPTSNDPMIQQAMRLEVVAAFINSLDAPAQKPKGKG